MQYGITRIRMFFQKEKEKKERDALKKIMKKEKKIMRNKLKVRIFM